MHTHILGPDGPQALGVHIRQITQAHDTTITSIMYVTNGCIMDLPLSSYVSHLFKSPLLLIHGNVWYSFSTTFSVVWLDQMQKRFSHSSLFVTYNG